MPRSLFGTFKRTISDWYTHNIEHRWTEEEIDEFLIWLEFAEPDGVVRSVRHFSEWTTVLKMPSSMYQGLWKVNVRSFWRYLSPDYASHGLAHDFASLVCSDAWSTYRRGEKMIVIGKETYRDGLYLRIYKLREDHRGYFMDQEYPSNAWEVESAFTIFEDK